jgi:hypothetical protein
MIDSFGRGTGDHQHIGGVELPYPFTDAATLLADFWVVGRMPFSTRMATSTRTTRGSVSLAITLP